MSVECSLVSGGLKSDEVNKCIPQESEMSKCQVLPKASDIQVYEEVVVEEKEDSSIDATKNAVRKIHQTECAIPGCRVSKAPKYQRENGVTKMFKIPLRTDEFGAEWKKGWIDLLHRYPKFDDFEERLKLGHVYVCERHFSHHDIRFTESGRKTLKPYSLPTINLLDSEEKTEQDLPQSEMEETGPPSFLSLEEIIAHKREKEFQNSTNEYQTSESLDFQLTTSDQRSQNPVFSLSTPFSTFVLIPTTDLIPNTDFAHIIEKDENVVKFEESLKDLPTKGNKKEKSYICKQCGKSFTEAYKLKSHISTHTGERSYKCAFCDKTFAYQSSMKRHEGLHKNKDGTIAKSIKCSLCDYSCTFAFKLTAHMRTHTGEKPYKCELCPKAFIDLTGLRVHMRHHTGEKPFKCDLCDYSSTQSQNLKTHRRTHTGEKPHQCQYCEKAFTRFHNLKVHLQKHENPKKKIVPKKTVRTKNLIANNSPTHLRETVRANKVLKAYHGNARGLYQNNVLELYRDGKPYLCDRCDHSCMMLSSLRYHMLSHNVYV